MIEVEHLTQRYGPFEAVCDLSFQVAPGEVVGFLGPNGAGKTTTLKVVASYLLASSGRVRVQGHDAATHPFDVRAALGYLPERCPLYEDLSVVEHLEWVGRVRGLPAKVLASAVERERARCGLEEVGGRLVSELSKGYRQRLGLACALLHDPPVVVLDEPTSGLDPNQVLEMRDLVRTLGEERAVLFSSHVLSEVVATCSRAIVIHQGRAVADEQIGALLRLAAGGILRAVVASASPSDAASLAGRLRELPEVRSVRADGLTLHVHPTDPQGELGALVFETARRAEVTLCELSPVQSSLDDVFARLTRDPEGA